jgi:putative ABC transport system permease protein
VPQPLVNNRVREHPLDEIYGTVSHVTASRRREIGIRMALGAERGLLFRMTLRDGLVVCGAGFGVGLPIALLVTRAMCALLYEVGPADPIALGLAILTLLITASLACFIPALRAARLNPTDAIRR